ncbi:GNAT family N-acetyltransferase [Irregularibacter muris]|uniref:GNAT family N-acetyltransferase n=1 Tax=Irregularibacter muris TaxID=1796619 RepID=A0AAE3HG22_9FIRM|nr:GNAT family N-acetyltransferase [Irregularibacter muris]MCR1899922.1 GNAT family N-acetyltransferase [Irregularibacter muris]
MVKLEKMSQQDFGDYLSNAIVEYAKEKIKAGTWAEKEAYKLSEEAFNKLLPDGVNTEKQYLFSIMNINEQIKIGYLWFQYSESLIGKEAFIYDFYIFEEFRGKGYGIESMKALDTEVRKLKIDKISLHVFSHNKRAISLYRKVGFVDKDLLMSKYI